MFTPLKIHEILTKYSRIAVSLNEGVVTANSIPNFLSSAISLKDSYLLISFNVVGEIVNVDIVFSLTDDAIVNDFDFSDLNLLNKESPSGNVQKKIPLSDKDLLILLKKFLILVLFLNAN